MTQSQSLTGAFKGNYVLVLALCTYVCSNPPGSGVIKKPMGHEAIGGQALELQIINIRLVSLRLKRHRHHSQLSLALCRYCQTYYYWSVRRRRLA